MPTGSRVDECYQSVRKQGHSEASAAKICQASTGEALSTGRPPKGKKKSLFTPSLRSVKLLRRKSKCKGTVGGCGCSTCGRH